VDRNQGRERKLFGICISSVEKGIGEARANPLKPVCIWFKTTKGKGVKSTEDSSSGGHGYPLQNAEKIVDFLAEIYSGFEYLPGEFRVWAEKLNEQWMLSEVAKKTKPSAPSAVKKAKIQAGLAKGAIEAAREGSRSIPFAAMFKVQPDR
jgi:transketolase